MKKNMRRQEEVFHWQALLIYLLIAYIVTAAMLFLLAFLVFQFRVAEQVVSVGIIITYALSGFLAGFLAGKKMKQKRFVWGLVMVLCYFLILFLLSLIVNKSLEGVFEYLFTTLILCAGGGMLGGMLS